MSDIPDYTRACRHLARRDPIMKRLIAAVGPCRMPRHANPFRGLVGSIISQQISTKAADTIKGRLLAALGDDEFTAQALLKLSEETLRLCGLSTNKLRSLRDLAEKVASEAVCFPRFLEMSDDEVIEALLPVRGIGRWTAQMFLIFSLGRPDVLAPDDLALRAGAKEVYGLNDLPDHATFTSLAEPWRPYRSVASWYLWRSRDVPKDKNEAPGSTLSLNPTRKKKEESP